MRTGNCLSGTGPEKVKVLVVDEDRDYFEQLQECADMCSHEFKVECIYSSDEKEALSIIEKEHPSIIVMDAYMPALESHGLLEKCNEGVVPLIVTSLYAIPELSDVSRRWGAEEYITKSENPDEVEEALRRIVELAVPFFPVQ